MKILYGTPGNYHDVTEKSFAHFADNKYLVIPPNDHIRVAVFGDPAFKTLKTVLIILETIYTCYHDMYAIVNLQTGTCAIFPATVISSFAASRRLKIVKTLNLYDGSFADEVPEQEMVAHFLSGHEHVLEIGGNIGRNSCLIGRITEKRGSLVVIESDRNNAEQLRRNRDLNGLAFCVEAVAISSRPLAQNGWNTKPCDALPRGWQWVATMSWQKLLLEHPKLDTLVADCEGALYHMLTDTPEMLQPFRTIILENDYSDLVHKKLVDKQLINCGFTRQYVRNGGWGPCKAFFYEVWTRKTVLAVDQILISSEL